MVGAKSLVHTTLFLALAVAFLARPMTALGREERRTTSSVPPQGKTVAKATKPTNGKEKLAVLDLDRSGVESELAFSMSVVLRDELFALGEYEVLGREDLMALAKRLSIQQAAGDECADDQCLVSYGRSLGTRFMVAGVLSKVGSTYSVSLRLLDTGEETGGVINRVYERCKCSQDELFDTVAAAAAKLMGRKGQPPLPAIPKSPATATPPEPAAPPPVPPLATISGKPAFPARPEALPAPSAPPTLIASTMSATPINPLKPFGFPAPPAPHALVYPARITATAMPSLPTLPETVIDPTKAIATAGTAPSPAERFTDAITGMEFVPVPGGCFQMGDTFGDGKSDELPVHEVCLDGFAIGKYEVTQGQWRKVMGTNPSRFQKGDDYPVENLKWEDAQAFVNKLNEKSGRHYRLPTEAEWEYAARSGGKREKYSGGNEVDEVGWHEMNSGFATKPVGTKKANGLGIHDMSGNVWEWCLDWRADDYYGASPRNNPPGPKSGPYHSVRGGCWEDNPFRLRASNRFRGTPAATRGGNVPGGYYQFQIFGFRLVLPQSK